MKFDVYYKQFDGFSTFYTNMQVETVDLETAKKTVNQWRVKNSSKDKKITIRSINKV